MPNNPSRRQPIKQLTAVEGLLAKLPFELLKFAFLFFAFGFEGGTRTAGVFPDEFLPVPDSGVFGVLLLSVLVGRRCLGEGFEVLLDGAFPDFFAVVGDGAFSVDNGGGEVGLYGVLVGLGLVDEVG